MYSVRRQLESHIRLDTGQLSPSDMCMRLLMKRMTCHRCSGDWPCPLAQVDAMTKEGEALLRRCDTNEPPYLLATAARDRK